jgi:D-alanine--poly(phosphoribitol) ligase subunit 2
MTLSAAKDELIYQEVTAHLSNKFNVKLGDGVNENTDLFLEGLIDSVGFLDLVAFLEKTFGIHFDESELKFDSVNTVTNIVATVKKRI